MYFRVRAKCGHVGRKHYIEKNFYVRASSRKEAAYIVRYSPRVKHHHKEAILNVKQITCKEFYKGIELTKEDKYFQVTNSSDQRLFCAVDPIDVIEEPQRVIYRKKRNVDFIIKRNKILERQCNQMMLEAIYG